jgi:hypothetical protein
LVSRIAPGTMLDVFVVVLENYKNIDRPQIMLLMLNR